MPELEKRAEASEDKAVRLFLVGHFGVAPRNDVLDLIEDAGGVVVGDDFMFGFKWIAALGMVTKDPLKALTDRHFMSHMLPSPLFVDLKSDWGGYIVNAAKRVNAQGVVNLVMKYCPPHVENYPRMKERIESTGMPHIMFELEHEATSSSLEGMKTRVQAFLETIRSKK